MNHPRNISDHGADPVAMGFATVDGSWRITSVSDSRAHVSDTESGSSVGMVLWDLFPVDEDSEFYRELHRAMEGRVMVQFERNGGPHGAVTEVIAYPVGDGLGLVTRDITRSKVLERDLASMREQTDDLIRLAPTGIYEVAFDPPRFLKVNDAMCSLSGYTREQLLSMDPMTILGPSSRVRFADRVARMRRGEYVPNDVLYEVIRGDGTSLHVVLKVQLLRDAEGRVTHAFVIGHDVTERVTTEAALRRSERFLQLLSDANALLLSTNEPETIIKTIAEEVVAQLGLDLFVNYMLEEGGQRLRLNASHGLQPDTARSIEHLELGQSICGCVARDGVRVLSEDVQHNEDPRAELVRSLGMGVYVCNPLRVGNRTVGTLSFGSSKVTTFSEDELDLLRAITDEVSIGLERAAAERELELELNRMRLLQEVGAAVSSARELDLIGDAVLSAIDRHEPLKAATISVLEGEDLRLVAWRGYTEEHVARIAVRSVHDVRFLASKSVVENRLVTHEDDRRAYERPGRPDDLDMRTARYAMAPIRFRRRIVGTISLVFEGRRPFLISETDTYQLVADVLGSSFENAGLHERERRAAELNEALTVIDNSIHSTLDLDVVLDRAFEEATAALDCESAEFLVRESAGWRNRHVYGVPVSLAGTLVTGSSAQLASRAAQGREPVSAYDVASGAEADDLVPGNGGVASSVVVPILGRDQVDEVVVLNYHHERHRFTPEEMLFLRRLGTSLGLAIENIGLFKYEERRRRRIEVLHGILDLAVTLHDVELAASQMLDYVMRNDTADFASVWLLNGEFLELAALANYPESYRAMTHPLPLDSPLDAATVCRTGIPCVVEDLEAANPEVLNLYASMGVRLGAYLILPMEARGHISGVFILGWHERHALDQWDIEFYESVAAEVGVVLENARLFEEHARRATLAEELNEANTLLLSSHDFAESWTRVLELAAGWLDADVVELRSVERTWSERTIVGEDRDQASGDEQFTAAIRRVAHRACRAAVDLVEEPVPQEVVEVGDGLVHLAAGCMPDGDGHTAAVFIRTSPFTPQEVEFISQLLAQASIARREARLRTDREWLSTARQQWLAGISHDLKTPLAAIRGYAELLAQPEDTSTEEVARQAGVIVQQSRRIQSLIADMLLTFQIHEGELPMSIEKVDLCSILYNIDEVLTSDPRTVGKRIVVSCESEMHESCVDERLLERALQNLVVNALVHAEGATTITMALRETPDGWQEVRIIDDGVGMSDDVLGRIWKRYERGPGGGADTDGVGLGMSITRQLVEAMGGNVAIESTAGVGTTVTVRLPGPAGPGVTS